MINEGLSIREKILESLNAPIVRALDRENLTLEYLAGKLKKELDAKETRFFQYQGKVYSERDVIAWEIRQRARQDAHRLRGDYPPDRKEIDLHLPPQISEIPVAERLALEEASRVYARLLTSSVLAETVESEAKKG